MLPVCDHALRSRVLVVWTSPGIGLAWGTFTLCQRQVQPPERSDFTGLR